MAETARQNYLHSRPRHPPDEAARFIETQIAPTSDATPVYHERLNDFVLVDEARRQDQISTDMWKQADEEKEELFRMMEKVRKKLMKRIPAGEGQSLAEINLRHCKWEDVMYEVQATGSCWRTSSSSSTKTIHCINKVGQNYEAFQSWLELLPAGDYGSSIAGVFKVIVGVSCWIRRISIKMRCAAPPIADKHLSMPGEQEAQADAYLTQAAGRYTKIEEIIFDALSDIPETMERARKYVQIYDENHDQSLEKETFELFRAILRALLQIMKFFDDSKTRKLLGPILQQKAYKSELEKSIEEIKKHTERVREQAQICHQERSRNLERTSLATNENTEKQLQNQETAMRILRDMHRLLRESPWMNLKTNNELLQPNAAFLMNNTMAAASRVLEQSPMPPPADNTESLRARLLEAIRYEPDVITKDIEANIRRGLALDDQPKAVAASLVTHPRFDAYFGPAAADNDEGKAASSALLVNGRMDPTTGDGASPLGLVVAEVARASTTGAYVVSYFCDRHRPGYLPPSSPGTSSANPVGAMVSSFMGQLLAQMQKQEVKPDFTFLKDEDWPRLQQGRLNTLCVAFVALVAQLPPGSVLLCMIDGATRYETTALGEDMGKLIRRLVRLVDSSNQDDEHRLVCKLLVTCRTRARGIAQYFDQGQDRGDGGILNLDGEIEATDSSNRRIAYLRNVG